MKYIISFYVIGAGWQQIGFSSSWEGAKLVLSRSGKPHNLCTITTHSLENAKGA